MIIAVICSSARSSLCCNDGFFNPRFLSDFPVGRFLFKGNGLLLLGRLLLKVNGLRGSFAVDLVVPLPLQLAFIIFCFIVVIICISFNFSSLASWSAAVAFSNWFDLHSKLTNIGTLMLDTFNTISSNCYNSLNLTFIITTFSS